jgi:hypothetical protein
MKMPLELRAAALAVVPMSFAIAGAMLDEYWHQGFTVWRSACRSTGLTLVSLISFTFELLPMALAGMLFGVLLLQFMVAALWYRPHGARVAFSAHAGCMLGMVAGLWLCLAVPSTTLMLASEAAVAAVVAGLLCRRPASPHCAASVRLPRSQASNAY